MLLWLLQVQNPPRHFWNFLLCYAFTMLLVKFIYQFPYFCVCANSYSSGASCPSRLSAYSQVCRADDTPKLDYYIHQPVVWDYALGVYKVASCMSPANDRHPVPSWLPHILSWAHCDYLRLGVGAPPSLRCTSLCPGTRCPSATSPCIDSCPAPRQDR